MKNLNSQKWFVLTVLLICCNAAWAYDMMVDGIYYNIKSAADLTVEVTKGDNQYSGDIVIPSTITYKSRTFAVTSIGYQAFSGCRGLKNVVVGSNVTAIASSAFNGCEELISIEIPSGLKSIDCDAFGDCNSLAAVYISDLATWCNIDFSDLLSDNPLSYAENLYLNGELVTDLVIPDGVTVIKKKVFTGCANFTSVVIPNSVTSIGESAFSGCTGLTSVVIPNSVTSIGKYAFSNCTGLTSVVIGDGVTSIGDRAFYGCSGLTSAEISNSVEFVGAGAFRECSNLISVVIGSSVTNVSGSAFKGCNSIERVCVKTKTPPSASICFENMVYLNSVLYVPAGCLEAYQNAEVWKEFWDIRELDATGINDVKNGEENVTTIYDINGRVVEAPTKGIYIMNGKKVIF